MSIEYFQKLLTSSSKRLSPPEKVAYRAAENEFTSEGAPPAATPDPTAAPPANAAFQRADTPGDDGL